MMIDDGALLSIVLPTRNRPWFVARTLLSWRAQGFAGTILVADASDERRMAETRSVIEAFPEMTIRHLPMAKAPGDEPVQGFFVDIASGVREAKSEFVLLNCDDDIYAANVVETCVTFLRDHPDYALADGAYIFSTISEDEVGVQGVARFGYDEERGFDRLRRMEGEYSHQFFAVCRRDVYLAAMDGVVAAKIGGWAAQFAVSMDLALRGKGRIFDELFCLRGFHETRSGGSVWPAIFFRDDFSLHMRRSVDFLVARMEQDMGIGREVTEPFAQRLMLHMVARHLGTAGRPSPHVANAMARIHDQAPADIAKLRLTTLATRQANEMFGDLSRG
ncbi:MAG: TIGR00180 family glycosyltransferase [Alphaproteobacteria bacterium]|nr:TIGR00180 family glycosyltransferase [Alphaproteobacteria bacterium]